MPLKPLRWIPDIQDSDLPTYKAIAESVKAAIDSGLLKPGDKLPTHRALADTLNLAIGTITRGYAEAERLKIIEAQVGSGTFVSSPKHKDTEFKINEEKPGIIDLSVSVAIPVHTHYISDSFNQIVSQPKLFEQLSKYHPDTGTQKYLEAHSTWLSTTGCQNIDAERIFTTMGGQHGLFVALSSICKDGDTIICDQLTYPGLIAIALKLNIKIIGIESDSEGLNIDHLELACQRHRPRALYLMTRISTPLGTTTSMERIKSISKIALENNILIVEDDVQGCLMPESTPVFVNYIPDNTIFISSVSKSMAGGLRIGTLYIPGKLIRTVRNTIRIQLLMPPPLISELFSNIALNFSLAKILEEQRAKLSSRNELASKILTDFKLNHSNYSLNLWLTLPSHWQSTSFTKAAKEEGILLKPAEAFATSNQLTASAVRISIGGSISEGQLNYSLSKIRELLYCEDVFNFS